MAYFPLWERLPDALTRVMESNACAQDDAQADICRAIADGAVNVRAKLGERTTSPMKSRDTVLQGHQFHIPTDLKPEEFDWQSSRPHKPWIVRREAFKLPGHWKLEWIELLSSDVTDKLCSTATKEDKSAQTASAKKISRRRSQPSLEGAQRAIEAMYSTGVPEPTRLPNRILHLRVSKWLRDNHYPAVSMDTVLRAAGRRK